MREPGESTGAPGAAASGPSVGEGALDPAGLDALPVAVLIVDRNGRLRTANRAWRELTGLNESVSRGEGWLRGLDPDDRALLLDDLQALPEDGQIRDADHRLATEGGEHRWTRWRLRAESFDAGPSVVMVVTDIDADRVLQGELQQRAIRDSLTELVNRAHFFELTGHALRRRHRHPSHLAVIYVDLNRFKDVNDALGHLAGDRALAAVAGALRLAVRPEDVIARVGGDEFAVLCEGLENPGAVTAITRRLQAALAEPLILDDKSWCLTAAIGIAFADASDRTPEQLLDRADRAMYQAKLADGSRGAAGPTIDLGPGTMSLPGHDAGGNGSSVPAAAAARLIQDLYDVGLTLASAASAATGFAAERLSQVIGEFDDVLAELRSTMLDHLLADPTPASTSDTHSLEPGLPAVVDELARAAVTLDTDARGRRDHGGDTIALIDATFGVHRSIVGLRDVLASMPLVRPPIG